MELTPQPKEKLEKLAWDILGGRILTDRQVPGNLLGSVFMPLIFLGEKDKDYLEQLGMIYEDMSQAGPRSINGYPMFMSMNALNKEDAKTVVERVIELEKMREGAIDKAKEA